MVSVDSRRIVFFNRWMHQEGQDLIESCPGIDVENLNWDDPEEENWPMLSSSHG